MIDKIIEFSLRNRLTVMVGVFAIILGGISTIFKMEVDVFPDLTAPQVVVMTDCKGMTAEETERLVTYPVETALNGATNVRRVRSSSNYGYSFVWIEFDWGVDVFRARQIVSENMVSLKDVLPDGISPQLAPQSSVMGEILFVGMRSNGKTNQMELRSLADWVVKPVILATGGVSQVTIIGGEEKQYQVLADPMLMDAYSVHMEDLAETVRTFSNNTEGGVVREYGNEYALRGMARTNNLDDMRQAVVKSENGKTVLLGDVASVVIAPAVKMGKASLDGKSGIILSISKQPNINTLEVTRKIEAALEDVKKSLPEDVELNTKIFRQADFIEASVNNVGRALVEGAIFVIIILLLFLGSVRTTFVSVAAIPLSLLGTIIILNLLGMNVNTMTLGGMCISIGSLVDDAIIDVENVYKRLRQNHLLPREERQSSFYVVFHASKEIRTSILNATCIIMAAFVPLFFLGGMEGRMLIPLGATCIIALFMSLVVAMTVTPLYCYLMLTDEKYLKRQDHDRRFVKKLQSAYSKSLVYALEHKRMVIGFSAFSLLVSIVLMTRFGSGFLPDFNEGSLTISAVCKPGVSLEETDHIGRLLEEKLHEVPEVLSTSRRTGRGELDEHSQTTNSSEIDVNFKPFKRPKTEVMREVRSKLAEIPGAAIIVGQPLGHRIDHMISGTRANIAIKLFGSDLNEMYMIANRIKQTAAGIEGLVDVNVDQQIFTPQIHIRPNRAALAVHGITMDEFNQMLVLGFSGEKVGEIYEGQRSYDLILRLSPEYTGTIDGVRKSLIDKGNGRKIPFEEVCEIVSTTGPNNITRENVQRKLVIAANVSGRDVVSVVKELQRAVDWQIELPEGYRVEYGGQFENSQSALRSLLIVSFFAFCVVFLMLYTEFKSLPMSLLVMGGMPLALIGGVVAIALSSRVVSIPSVIGFITLFGIAVRNGILLLSHFKSVAAKKDLSLRESITIAAVDRLTPILMTALTSDLALIPLVLNGDKAGNEIQSPMAIVVLGGLISSTLLNLYLMPVVYEWYIKRHSSAVRK